jgi:cell wall-associated NlpC family hydrolase
MKINIELAKKYLGRPYVWGGNCEAEGGYDCSGFVFQVLHQSGFKVNRDTAQGYYNTFSKYETSKTNIATGDLLFFGKSKKSITHIAIALDGKTMIESIGSSRNTIKNKGKGVSISNIARRKDLVAVCRFENVSRETLKVPKPVLRIGSKGIEVSNLQKCLNLVGNYKLVIDGHFGKKTYNALCDFQTRHILIRDGIYGLHTYTAMRNLIGGV